MIEEWIMRLRCSCAPATQKLGYLDEAIAIPFRHRRNQYAWHPHLGNSKKLILQAAKACAQKNSAVIQGSGSLLDVPLAELADEFRSVTLVDIVHLPPVHRAARKFTNVEMIETDLSETSNQLMQTGGNELPSISRQSLEFGTNPDLIVSLNLLSQLPLMPLKHLRNAGNHTEDKLEDWAKKLQETHWSWINETASNNCIITDVLHTQIDESSDAKDVHKVLHLNDLPTPTATWEWLIAPKGEISRTTRLTAQVQGWIL